MLHQTVPDRFYFCLRLCPEFDSELVKLGNYLVDYRRDLFHRHCSVIVTEGKTHNYASDRIGFVYIHDRRGSERLNIHAFPYRAYLIIARILIKVQTEVNVDLREF